jgi:pimeloyl-ACP methyl ester carboxylesterase
VDIHYDEAGSGPDLMLLHGLTYDGRVWAPQAAMLTRRFRVVVPDLRGHGKSSAPERGYNYSDYAEDILGLADTLGMGAMHLCGLSIGGGVAVELALAVPERVRSLTLVSPAIAGWRFSAGWRTYWRQLLAARRDRGLEAAMREVWLAADFHRGARSRPEGRLLLEAMVSDFSGLPFDALVAARDGRETLERLGEIGVPTSVLVGDQDHPDFQGMAERVAKSIPGASLHKLVGVRHLPNLEAPDEVGDRIVDHALAVERRSVGAVA